ncbi:MAG: helix-turn-helix transcriptional regulator [Leptospiraceae bacterium]|nr:helix-turn-helix transcriptional regulator [Leptospiraceae bacterium]
MNSGDRIKIIQKTLGRSQKELAEDTNFTQGAISKYINGRDLDAKFIIALKDSYNINPTWLLTGEGEMFIHPPSASGGIPGSGNVNISGNKSGGDFTVKNIGHVTNHLHEYYLNEDESTLIILLRKKKNRKQVIEAIKAMLS